MLSAIMLSVVAPFTYQKQNKYKTGQVYFMSKLAQGDQKIGSKFAQLFEKVAKTVTKSKMPLSV
jgi:hypothetical protein